MRKSALLLLACCLAAAGCNGVVAGASALYGHNYANREGINFAAHNYAVADYLIQQADSFIKKQKSLIVAEPLTDIQSPETPTTISQLIPEQIGVRLSQLGYRVDLGKVTTSPDTNYLRPTLKTGEEADFVITGNYLRRRKTVDVKVRIIDVKNDRIVASFDYPLEMKYEDKELATPKPVIMRVEP